MRTLERSRSRKTKAIARIPYRHMDWVWVSDHYDIHLKGLCRYGGRLCRFETDFDNRFKKRLRCRIYALQKREKVTWLAHKALFEACVGTHWSYPHRARRRSFHLSRPRWFAKLLFATYYFARGYGWIWLRR